MILRSFSNAVTAVCRRQPIFVCAAWLAATLALGAGARGDSAPPAVVPAEAPAAGRHTARVTVPAFGRYAIEVASEQGASLELVDRMAGSLGVAGSSGTANGRLDVFLTGGGTFGTDPPQVRGLPSRLYRNLGGPGLRGGVQHMAGFYRCRPSGHVVSAGPCKQDHRYEPERGGSG